MALPYSLLTTVETPALVLTVWDRAYSSYFTSTQRMSFSPPQPDKERKKTLCGSRNTVDGLIVSIACMAVCVKYLCMCGFTHADMCMWTFQAHQSSWPGCSFSNKNHQSCKEIIDMIVVSPLIYFKFPFPLSVLSNSLETGIWDVQVPISSQGDNGRAHLHAGFAADKPLGISGKANQIPFSPHLQANISEMTEINTIQFILTSLNSA